MSTYLTAFVRKDDDFIPIFDLNVRFGLGSMFKDVPYGKVIQLTDEILKEAESEVEILKEASIKSVESCNDELTFLASCNNSIDDKLSQFNDILDTKKESNDCIEDCNRMAAILEFLADMVVAAKFSDEPVVKFYIGVIENPTVDMIEEK